jgi:hypothetical protein
MTRNEKLSELRRLLAALPDARLEDLPDDLLDNALRLFTAVFAVLFEMRSLGAPHVLSDDEQRFPGTRGRAC